MGAVETGWSVEMIFGAALSPWTMSFEDLDGIVASLDPGTDADTLAAIAAWFQPAEDNHAQIAVAADRRSKAVGWSMAKYAGLADWLATAGVVEGDWTLEDGAPP